MSYFTIGRWTVPASLLAITLAVIISYFVFFGKEKRQPGDWYWNSLLLFVIIYKLSYAILNFSLFISFPMSLIYFNGGIKGQLIAAVFIAIYLFRLYKKNKPNLLDETTFLLMITFFAFQIVFNLLEQNFMLAGIQTAILLGYTLYEYTGRKKTLKIANQMILFFFLMDLLFLSFFDQLMVSYNLSFIFINFVHIITQYFSKEGQEA